MEHVDSYLDMQLKNVEQLPSFVDRRSELLFSEGIDERPFMAAVRAVGGGF